MTWVTAEEIGSERLVLEPLRVEHAADAAAAFGDPGLHAFIGGRPATADELRERFGKQVAGHSPDGGEGWLNWMARHREDGAIVGTFQATLSRSAGTLIADVAWIVATPAQGRGLASEGARAVAGWLRGQGVDELVAYVHPDHAASVGVARALELSPTDVVVDGEVRWERRVTA